MQHKSCRSQSERVTAGSDSTTSSNSNNVVLVDMRPAEDAEFGLDEIMVRALQEVSPVFMIVLVPYLPTSNPVFLG